ncbi:coil containing protein [Vibrio phage 1.205.O._10N.222.51.A7]|nr:coil containing protein [Vibrio phage 1.205.O._10N.222.51.A7]
MKIASVQIKNILGVSALEFNHESGSVIEISGGNGKGKTSTLEAIKDAFGASAYSSLIRNGEESGEVVLDFGDIIVNRKYKAEGTPKTTVKARLPGSDKYGAVGSPAKYIKSLTNASSLDPASLLSAKPKELIDIVLNSMPIYADANRIMDITGVSHDVSGHALNVISEIGKSIFDERTGVNREGKQLQGTIASLRETLPEELPSKSELEQQVTELQDSNLNIHEEFNAERAKVDEEAKGKVKDCESELTKINLEIGSVSSSIHVNREETNAKVIGLQKQIDALKNEHELFASKQMGEQRSLEQKASSVRDRHAVIEDERERQQSDIDNKVVTKQQENNQQINQLQNSISQCAVIDNTLNNVKNYEAQLQQISGKSKSMGEQIKMLNEYKEELCQALPIEGLEIKEGNLLLDGVSFETLNTAARLTLVVKLAELNAGDCGVVILDNTEMMDSETYTSFLAEADKTDLTFIVARVTDGDLKIESK